MHFGPAVTERHSCGTTIAVRDLFYRWPVRQKQASMSTSHHQAVFSEVRRAIEQLAIINPGTALTLVDMDRSDSASVVLSLHSASTSLSVFGMIWGHQAVEKAHLIDHKTGDCCITGFFSLVASHTKLAQLIAVNKRPIGTSDLHRRINKLFSRSSFSRISELAYHSQGEDITRQGGRPSLRRQLDHQPIFYLHIELPGNGVDFGLEPNKRTVCFAVRAHFRLFAGETDV